MRDDALTRVHRPRAGAGLLPVIVLAVLVLGGIVLWLGSAASDRSAPESGGPAPSAPIPDDATTGDDPARLGTPRPRVAADRSALGDLPRAAGVNEEWERDEFEPTAPVDAGDPAHHDLRIELDGQLARLIELRRGDDPVARLALAREILATDEQHTALTMAALNALAELDPAAAVEEISRRLAARDPHAADRGILSRAIDTLARAPDTVSDAELTGFFEQGGADVQLSAARALAQRGDDSLALRYEEHWIDRLANDDWHMRVEAVQRLSMSRPTVDPAPLLPLLDDPHDEVRLAALSVLGQSASDPAVLERIRLLTNDPSENVRRIAGRLVERMER